MLEHNLGDRTNEIVDYLMEHSSADISDALHYVYNEDLSVDDLPEEYLLHIHEEVYQCVTCGSWKTLLDINIEKGTCLECE